MDIVSQLAYNRSRDRFSRLEQYLFLAFSCLAFSASPSYSSLIALGGSRVDQDTIYKYLKTYSTLTNSGKTVILCWIPGHEGIPGNERADRVAKDALSLPISPVKVSAMDAVILNRLQIGHTRATHAHLLGDDEAFCPPKPNLQPPRGGGW